MNSDGFSRSSRMRKIFGFGIKNLDGFGQTQAFSTNFLGLKISTIGFWDSSNDSNVSISTIR